MSSADTVANTNSVSNVNTDNVSDINTDGRTQYDWKSKYPPEACKEMKYEAAYIIIMLFLSLILLFFNYLGLFSEIINLKEFRIVRFEYMIYFLVSGLLGGIVFGMKYFYRAIARGYWSLDRRYWRILSPFISMCIALIVGVMVSAGLLPSDNSLSNSWAVAFGFFSGYYADEAVGKMYEIATLLFGKQTKK